jgi:hypothetical protein
MIRVLVAEDMHLVRGARVALLSLGGDMEVVAELEHGDQIIATAPQAGTSATVVCRIGWRPPWQPRRGQESPQGVRRWDRSRQ